MTTIASNDLWSVFDARRVKAPELKGLDPFVNSFVGFVKNHVPKLVWIKRQAERIERIEPEIHELSSARFQEEITVARELARRKKLVGAPFERAVAVAREAVLRSIGKRPFLVQVMGALAMTQGAIAEMATGEGKTLTAAMTASIQAWSGRPVHVITVNDYLVQRDAEQMAPIYKLMGHEVGYVIHDTTPMERVSSYRKNVVYVTSKELVADFLRDQIQLGNLRNSTQTVVGMMAGNAAGQVMVPGLFRVLVDEADSLLIDEAVTPLIISNSPDEEANATLYRAAHELAEQLELNRDFTIDWAIRNCDLTARGQDRLDEIAGGQDGFWKGRRRREELVTQALTGLHCYIRDEQYLVTDDEKVQIIDEFTGRVMADRSWRHGLHQAIEIKEAVPVTADKENLARLSFQRFFRQYPLMAGMTGTAWEAAPEFWQIYQRLVIRIPPNKPCIRQHLPTRMFDTADRKWEAVTERVKQLHENGVPILIGTRSVLASQEVSRRLAATGLAHRVLNATHTAEEAAIVAQAGQERQITVATNMAGRGTDIILGRGVAEMGGLHVIATEPHGSHRVDRQLFGRAARRATPAALRCSPALKTTCSCATPPTSAKPGEPSVPTS